MFNILKDIKVNSLFEKAEKRSKENINNTQMLGTSEKASPSGAPFFVLKKMNWGMRKSFETNCTEYYMYPDKRIEYQYNGCMHGMPAGKPDSSNANNYWSGLKTKTMKDKDFTALCKLLKDFPDCQPTKSYRDGTGYEMTLYDAEGNIIHTIYGYISGNEVLEKNKGYIFKQLVL